MGQNRIFFYYDVISTPRGGVNFLFSMFTILKVVGSIWDKKSGLKYVKTIFFEIWSDLPDMTSSRGPMTS